MDKYVAAVMGSAIVVAFLVFVGVLEPVSGVYFFAGSLAITITFWITE